MPLSSSALAAMSAPPEPMPVVDEYADYEDEKQPQKHAGATPVVANTPEAKAKIAFACAPGKVADMHVDPELAPKKGGRPKKAKKEKEKEKVVACAPAPAPAEEEVETLRTHAAPSVVAPQCDDDQLSELDEKEFTEKEVMQVLILGAVSGLALGWMLHKWLGAAMGAVSKK